MITRLKNLLRPQPSWPAPEIPQGERVYAVGDIHGRLDLFAAIAAAVEADDQDRDAAQTTVILLGDLIDRGPDSAAVIDGARAWQKYRTVRILAGNHEEMLLDSLEDIKIFRQFLRYGGQETILSYPIDERAFRAASLEDAQTMMRSAVPNEDIAFLRGLEDQIVIGGYLFVHAGISPGTPLGEQKVSNLRWIREPFLSDASNHGHLVVHGHTIQPDVVVRPNRIGIDTGAYYTGKLTALGLEGSARWLIEAVLLDGAITVSQRPLVI